MQEVVKLGWSNIVESEVGLTHPEDGFRIEPFLQGWTLSNLPGVLRLATQECYNELTVKSSEVLLCPSAGPRTYCRLHTPVLLTSFVMSAAGHQLTDYDLQFVTLLPPATPALHKAAPPAGTAATTEYDFVESDDEEGTMDSRECKCPSCICSGCSPVCIHSLCFQ